MAGWCSLYDHDHCIMVRKMKRLIAFGVLLMLIGAAAVLLSCPDEGEFVDTENQVRYELGGIK